MDTKASNSPPDRWSLYADPSIFQVAVRTTDDGWIQMTLEVDPERLGDTQLQAGQPPPCFVTLLCGLNWSDGGHFDDCNFGDRRTSGHTFGRMNSSGASGCDIPWVFRDVGFYLFFSRLSEEDAQFEHVSYP